MKSIEAKSQFDQYFEIVKGYNNKIPNLIGLPAMDAISILENMNFNVQTIGSGRVVKQSLKKGSNSKKGTIIILELL